MHRPGPGYAGGLSSEQTLGGFATVGGSGGDSTIGGPRDERTFDGSVGSTGGGYEADAPALASGTVIADAFRIERVVGAGGMGIVYKAQHLKLGRPVALKMHRVADPLEAARVEREARAMALVSHPNVIGVYDVGHWQGRVFIAMEYVDGTTARVWLSRRPRFIDVMRMGLDAGRGLAAAHTAGLIHRDFKPDNVLVGRDGRVRVADFGLARAASVEAGAMPQHSPGLPSGDLSSSLTSTGSILGTPAYMSPEQFGGVAVDARADQFAYCVFLYEALYGMRPFAGATPLEVLYNITEGKILPEPEGVSVPSAVREVLCKGLRHRPEERYPNMDALLRALEQALRRPTKTLVAAVGSAALVLTGLVGGGVWMGWSRSKPIPLPTVSEITVQPPVEITVPPPVEVAVLDPAQERARKEEAFENALGDLLDPETPLAQQEAAVEAVDEILQDPMLSVGAIVAGSLDAVEKSNAGPGHRPVWDGRSTLTCGMFDNFELREMTISVTEGPAFEVEQNCRLRVVDCTIDAPIVATGTGAHVTIEGGTVRATEALVQLTMGTLELRGVKMDAPVDAVAVSMEMGEATIENCEIRGEVALAAGMNTVMKVERSVLHGTRLAIEAGMRARVQVRDVQVEGPIERGMHSVVEQLP